MQTRKNRITRLHAGERLRERRVRLGLTLREVEARSGVIARKLKSKRFKLPFSRLSELETDGQAPNIFRLHALAQIYGLHTSELLEWYGVPYR